MQRDKVDDELSELAFDFFFAFSRFEFALKENGYLRDHTPDAVALPGWSEFVAEFSAAYKVSAEAQELLKASPEQQVVGNHDALSWRAVDLSRSNSELDSVVKLLKTIRNNLFHGGKHSAAGWDDVPRTKTLLQSGLVVLEQLAALDAVLEPDFARLY